MDLLTFTRMIYHGTWFETWRKLEKSHETWIQKRGNHQWHRLSAPLVLVLALVPDQLEHHRVNPWVSIQTYPENCCPVDVPIYFSLVI